MKNRKIINPSKLKFTPFNSYGKPISGMSWHKISYNQNTGVGSYVLKMAPGARSLKHKHQNYEEFYVLDGELTDEIIQLLIKVILFRINQVLNTHLFQKKDVYY